MSNILPTVTVAICACNESANITPLLNSILTQKEEGYVLSNIFVISDGSTDDTVKLINRIESPKIVLKAYTERLGKSYRLNEIYGDIKSDFVVQPDADVILAHSLVVRDIISPMTLDPTVGMTGGNPIPEKTETFVEKSIECTYRAYTYIREAINDGNNIWTATGRLVALRRNVYSHITVPVTTISNDHYVYFSTLTQGYTYKYVDTARVYFRLPQTLHDHISQETRFSLADSFMKKYYPAHIVDKEYEIPTKLKMYAFMVEFIKHPVLCTSVFILNRYCKLRSWFVKKKTNSLWEIVYSTKKLIN